MRVVAATAVVLTGCFYLDPIITRPGALIELLSGHSAPRDSHITAMATFDDPKRHGSFNWHTFACGVLDQGPSQGALTCDDTDLPMASTDPLDVRVPVLTAGGQLVTQILVKLEARDDRGALATAEEAVTVVDGPPTLDLEVHALAYTVGAPIDVFAKFGDPEFPFERVDLTSAITWSVTPTTALVDIAVPPPEIPDRTHSTIGKRFIPEGPGDYVVSAIAQDPGKNTTMTVVPAFGVKPDQPPCLAQWQPAVPPPGQRLPVSEPTVFQVPLVADDLDAFPRLSDDPAFGAPAFAWSILLPGETQRRPLGDMTGNRISFDPGAFTPGDTVELRVEIFDRKTQGTALPCDDSAATCAITADATCLQRQTWRVEVR